MMQTYSTHPKGAAGVSARRAMGLVVLMLAGAPGLAAAQTDFYNTDAGRPMQVEDATPVERGAFELQVAPLRLERTRGASYQWGVEPELAWGMAARTQLELGLPIAWLDRGGDGSLGVAGADLALLHQFNVESQRLPSFGVSAGVLLPVGSLAAGGTTFATAKGIATRTFGWGRLHANGQVTRAMGGDRRLTTSTGVDYDAGPSLPSGAEVSRWAAGVAADHTWPLRALLASVEVYAREPFADEEEGVSSAAEIEWSAAAGARLQVDPRWAIDAGFGNRFTGDDRGWFFTFGAAVTLGMPGWRVGR